MSLRESFTEQLKAAMLARQPERVSALRMITSKLKDADIAGRPKGVDKVPDDEIVSMLRGMVKSRRESVALYKQGNRQDLVDKEEAEIAIIQSFLPSEMDEAATEAAIMEAIASLGATSVKDMGKVIGVLKAKHAASLDMARVGPLVKARLGG